MEIKENYKHSIYISQWALINYFKAKKITTTNQKAILKKVNPIHYLLLSFFVDCCTNKKGFNRLVINGVKYTQIDDRLILNNLPLFTDYLSERNTRVNKLKKWVKRLEDFGFIKRHIHEKTKRYIAIDSKLLYWLNKGDLPLNPLEYLNKSFENELTLLEREYSNKFRYNKYENLREEFFNKIQYDLHMEKENYTDLQDLLIRFKSYLDSSLKD